MPILALQKKEVTIVVWILPLVMYSFYYRVIYSIIQNYIYICIAIIVANYFLKLLVVISFFIINFATYLKVDDF